MTESGPTTTIMLTLRSAEPDAISQADFNYTDELASRCDQFDLGVHGVRQDLDVRGPAPQRPACGEKRFAWMQTTKPHGAQDFGSVGLRVLAGTMSVTLGPFRRCTELRGRRRPPSTPWPGWPKESSTRPRSTRRRSPRLRRTPAPRTTSWPCSRESLDRTGTRRTCRLRQSSARSVPALMGPAVPGGTAAVQLQWRCLPVAHRLGGWPGDDPGSQQDDFVDLTVVSLPTTAAPPYPFDTQALRSGTARRSRRTWAAARASGRTSSTWACPAPATRATPSPTCSR